MNFSEALNDLKEGRKMFREGWNGENMHLEIQIPDENSKMGKPYIFIKIVTGEFVPWVASNGDLLGEDWLIVNEGNSEGGEDQCQNQGK